MLVWAEGTHECVYTALWCSCVDGGLPLQNWKTLDTSETTERTGRVSRFRPPALLFQSASILSLSDQLKRSEEERQVLVSRVQQLQSKCLFRSYTCTGGFRQACPQKAFEGRLGSRLWCVLFWCTLGPTSCKNRVICIALHKLYGLFLSQVIY